MKKRVFISLKEIYAAPSIFKIALSDRSDGKTTALQLRGVDTFDETGKSAVFVRRFSTEFNNKFFDDFVDHFNDARPELLRERKFDIIKPNAKRCGEFLLQPKDGDKLKPAFSFLPITMAGRFKSALSYHKNKDVFFDEYIPLDGRYTKNEVTAILELYRTLDREHYDNKIMVCGNKITANNPIFDYFKIRTWKKGINTYQNGALSLLVCSLSANVENAQNGVFGALVAGTEYEAYNGGGFLHTNNHIILREHSRLLLYRIAHAGNLYGVYVAGAALVIDRLHNGAPPSMTLCISPQPPQISAIWLDDETAAAARATLEKHKYRNALFFADEQIYDNLRQFYARI